MIVLDTTVLVYAVGGEHRYRGPCRALIEAIGAGRLRATTSVEVVQEFAHVRARRRGRGDARSMAMAYADLLAPLLPVKEIHLRTGLEWWERQSHLGAFDAVLAAMTVEAGGTALVSSDRAFASVEHVDHVLPDEHGIAGLLA